ncbi:MAG: WbqC family protein [Bacteroidetes bacterium]|nr:WbqC family protein [Bacteroidota bacterium]
MLNIDIQYFGSISFVKTLLEQDQVYFDLEAPFTKMSFKNRMVITSSQGPLHLSIPIIGGRTQKTPIKDILIANNAPWQEQHLKALITNYNRSPYFEYYEQDVCDLYLKPKEKLVDFLLDCHVWLQSQLKAKWVILPSPIDIGFANKYFDTNLPKNYNQHQGLPSYQQVFSDKVGFVPNVSILDMLFCCGGKETNKLLGNLPLYPKL